MPTYEYKCTVCENRYETREGFDSPARQPCPKCGEVAKRILFPPPIVFKGGGFYITDSRKGSQATVGTDLGGNGSDSKSGDAKPAESKKESASAPSASSDSKPAAASSSSD